MPIEGPLRELGIHDVFQLLDLSRKTGVLRITSDLRQNAGTIYFDGGAVIHAEIRSNPHPLGRMLVRAGKISEADLERARALQERQQTGRVGEILVDIGAISHREVERQARRQVEEVIFEIMRWEEGYFSFTEEPLGEVPGEVRLHIPVEALLMEGARRIDEWSRIQRRVRHLGVIPVLAPAPDGEESPLDLLPPEWETLAAIDGHRDVRELAASLGRAEFEVAKTLFGLASTGIVTLVEPASPSAGTPDADVTELVARAEDRLAEDAYDEALVAAQLAAHADPHAAGVRMLLGRIHLAAGRATDAEQELRRAVRLDPRYAPGQRLLGFACCALGRFDQAVAAWDRWADVADEDPGERAHEEEVERAREAARVIVDGIRGIGQ